MGQKSKKEEGRFPGGMQKVWGFAGVACFLFLCVGVCSRLCSCVHSLAGGGRPPVREVVTMSPEDVSSRAFFPRFFFFCVSPVVFFDCCFVFSGWTKKRYFQK